jgi:hypothetical protein
VAAHPSGISLSTTNLIRMPVCARPGCDKYARIPVQLVSRSSTVVGNVRKSTGKLIRLCAI